MMCDSFRLGCWLLFAENAWRVPLWGWVVEERRTRTPGLRLLLEMGDGCDHAGDDQVLPCGFDQLPDQGREYEKARAHANELRQIPVVCWRVVSMNVNPFVGLGSDVTSSSEHACPFGEVVK